MESQIYAWVFYLIISLLFLHSMWRFGGWLKPTWLRELCLITVAVVLLAPAAVPGHEGYYAPATLVALFETLFQKPGQSEAAIFMLQLCLGIAWLLMLVVRSRVLQRLGGLSGRGRTHYRRMPYQ